MVGLPALDLDEPPAPISAVSRLPPSGDQQARLHAFDFVEVHESVLSYELRHGGGVLVLRSAGGRGHHERRSPRALA